MSHTAKQKGHPQGCLFCLEMQERPDLNNLIATVRWTVAAAGWKAANLNFCQRQKCKQIWPVPPEKEIQVERLVFLFQ